MRKVLMVQPSLQPPGGGNAVCAWMLQALRGDYQLTLLTWTPVDLDRVNEYYGTSLEPRDFTALVPPEWIRSAIDSIPASLAMLKIAVLRRRCKQIADGFDVLMAAHDETDFGRPGIQFIHFPFRNLESLPENLRPYHRGATIWIYARMWSLVAPFDDRSMRRNVTLVNSEWTAGVITHAHGIPSRVG